jgi:hypothetical protein
MEDEKAEALTGDPHIRALYQECLYNITNLEKHYMRKVERIREHRGFLSNYMRRVISHALQREAKKLEKWAEQLNEPTTIDGAASEITVDHS